MKILLRHIIVVLVLLFSMSYSSYGQDEENRGNPCPPSQRYCRGACRPAPQCAPGPPPPGLVVPIDTNLSFLFVAGLGLGIYFLVSAGKKEQFRD